MFMIDYSKEKRKKIVNILVAWYALYQALHIMLNSAYLLGLAPWFPPPPPEGWASQTSFFFNGMAFLDLINAVFSLIFAAGYFQKKPGSSVLGIVTLTISMYAAALFTIGTITSGAWDENLLGYLWFYIPFIPIIALYILLLARMISSSNNHDPL